MRVYYGLRGGCKPHRALDAVMVGSIDVTGLSRPGTAIMSLTAGLDRGCRGTHG